MKPLRLHKGDTVGIVSPSRWLKEVALNRAIKQLKDAGYPVIVGSATPLREHQYAGNTEDRVKELEDMFKNKDVKIIFCARGGYGAIRVTDQLNYGLIKQNPKIFVGYSDITALHSAILKSTNLTTFHGPMLLNFSEKVDSFSWHHLWKVLSTPNPIELKFPEDQYPLVLREGVGEGPLFGGNLTLLINMIGTRWDFETDGKILFIEDVDEKLYSLDRKLLHLKRAGKLDHLAGLMVGDMTKISDEEIPFGKSFNDIVMDVCSDTHYPIASHFPFGHGVHQMTLPINVKSRLDCMQNNVSFSLLEGAVI